MIPHLWAVTVMAANQMALAIGLTALPWRAWVLVIAARDTDALLAIAAVFAFAVINTEARRTLPSLGAAFAAIAPEAVVDFPWFVVVRHAAFLAQLLSFFVDPAAAETLPASSRAGALLHAFIFNTAAAVIFDAVIGDRALCNAGRVFVAVIHPFVIPFLAYSAVDLFTGAGGINRAAVDAVAIFCARLVAVAVITTTRGTAAVSIAKLIVFAVFAEQTDGANDSAFVVVANFVV